jgi:hypothetical protein
MNEANRLADDIEQAARRLLGHQAVCHTIVQWCEEYRVMVSDIQSGRGVALPSVAIVGAKGQGKTWIARQMILDRRIADLLPSGVLAKEATEHLTWIGPSPPEGLNAERESYVPCPSHCMLDLGRTYMIIDTPGYTDDDPVAAASARDAMSLAPIKLIVARRDQLRSAIHAQLAALTDGAVCLPIINCTPLNEIDMAPPPGMSHRAAASVVSHVDRASESLRSDIEWYVSALAASAPGSKILEPILVADFEADGDEDSIGMQLATDLRQRLAKQTMESLAATKAHRLAAASERLRHRVGTHLESRVPQLAASVRRLHAAADALPAQAIEAVLGTKNTLKTAIRDRVRADIISSTSLLWFPYRTILNILGLTHGAWDRLLMAMTGSIPSIFGTFAAWARNWGQSRDAQREVQNGIREQLHRQIQDRLEPAQQQFYRAVARIQGGAELPDSPKELMVRLSGIDELQLRARETFDFTFEQLRAPKWLVQLFGLFATVIFWGLFAGPIMSIYRAYFRASYQAWMDPLSSVSDFPHPTFSMLATAAILSALPVLVSAMLVMSWFQRARRLNRIAESIYAAELKQVEELKRSGVIQLHYDDPLLRSAEFLVHLDRPRESPRERAPAESQPEV